MLIAPLPISLFYGTIREPDVLYVSEGDIPVPPEEYPSRISVAIEVVSSGQKARNRDYVEKRADYAKAGVVEYWIVDPEEKRITVLSLDGDRYVTVIEAGPGDVASSRFFEGFAVNADEVFALGEQPKCD